MAFVACLLVSTAMDLYSQNSSDVAASRVDCARGLGEQAVSRAQAMGFRMGLADVCIKALNWSADNDELLAFYGGNSGQGDAQQIVDRITENAQSSTRPFRSSGSPQEMLQEGHLIPSLVFDAGFTRSFLEKAAPPTGSIDMATLRSRTEGCLSESQSLAVCANVGRIQGALAYQTSSAFSGTTTAHPAGAQGPDQGQTEAAIDQKFQNWAQSWSWDRYNPGSAHVTSIDCSGSCKASGEFTFTRLGTPHTIPFVAFLRSEGGGKYSLGRLCYDDSTTGSRDCTD